MAEQSFPNLLIPVVVLMAVVIPRHLLLLLCLIPLIVLSDYLGLIPPVLSIGDVDIRVYDLVTLVVAMRALGRILVMRQRVALHPLYVPVGAFLVILFATTVSAYYKFGEDVFRGEVVPFLRFLAQVAVLFLVVLSSKTQHQKYSGKLLSFPGYALAGAIYFNLLLLSIGISFGEMQMTSESVRYFGPVGDQVGFILLFFIFKSLLDRSLKSGLFFAGALLATGTRGAVIALAAGLVVLFVQMRKDLSRAGKRVAISLGGLTLISGCLFLSDMGSIRTRFSGSLLESGLAQRILTARLGLQVFIDNPFTGVGYTGFRYLATEYGAWEAFSKQLGYSPNLVATTGNEYIQVATDGGLLALSAFVWMCVVFLRTLKSAAALSDEKTRNLYLAGYIWLLSLLIGNQSAVWLLPGSLISYTLWIILGLAVSAQHATRGLREVDSARCFAPPRYAPSDTQLQGILARASKY